MTCSRSNGLEWEGLCLLQTHGDRPVHQDNRTPQSLSFCHVTGSQAAVSLPPEVLLNSSFGQHHPRGSSR